MNYKPLVKKAYLLYLREIDEDQFRDYFRKWAKKNEYPLPKMIRFLKNTAYNDEGDIVPIVNEDDKNIYYNDNFDRYCYLAKSGEDLSCFEFVTI